MILGNMGKYQFATSVMISITINYFFERVQLRTPRTQTHTYACAFLTHARIEIGGTRLPGQPKLIPGKRGKNPLVRHASYDSRDRTRVAARSPSDASHPSDARFPNNKLF